MVFPQITDLQDINARLTMDFFDHCNTSSLEPYTVPLGRQRAKQLIDAIVHKPFYPDTPSIYLQIPFNAHVDYGRLEKNIFLIYTPETLDNRVAM